MEIIEKLQANFQNIVNDINPEYEVIVRLKDEYILNTFTLHTLERFNLTLKELKSSKSGHIKYRAYLFIYLNQKKGIKVTSIARVFKTTHQNVSYLINTYTDNFINKQVLDEYKHFVEIMNNK